MLEQGEGRYKMICVLGQGGMGTVYAAEDRRLPGKLWAIKEIRAAEYGVAGMAQEAETLIRLSHPNLPHIVDYFTSEDGKCGYLVMERIEGQTLDERFEQSGRSMPMSDIVHYAIQLCDVLSYLHASEPHPIVHRDLKPANILIDRHGRLVLIDFGTARAYKSGRARDTAPIGTIGFAAPEQLADEQTDPRTDLYTLGSILFYLLSGGKHYLLAETSVPATLIRLPQPLIDLIGKLLKPAREERYQTAADVKEDLLNAVQMHMESGKKLRSTFAEKSAAPKKRMIILLSLYPGAGSTMIGLSLTAWLRRYGIRHAYMEQPGIEPVLAEWLDRLCEVPEGYEDWLENVSLGRSLANEMCRRSDSTLWLPLARLSANFEWTMEMQLRLLYEIDAQVVLLDASHNWETNAVENLVRLADELCVVCGPSRLQLQNGRSHARIDRLYDWSEEGKRVTVFLNGFGSIPDITSVFPGLKAVRTIKLPICQELLSFEWRGDPDDVIRDSALADWSGKIDGWLGQRMKEWGVKRPKTAASSRWINRLLKKV